MELGNIYENTAWLYDYYNRDNLIDDIPFYKEYALKSGGEVLELGCGTGRVALKLAEAGFKIIGLDLPDKGFFILNVFRPYKELDKTWRYDEVVQWETIDDNCGYRIVKQH